MLAEAPDARVDVAVGQPAHAGGEAAVVDMAGEEIVGGKFRQHVGGVGQRVLHCLAHARLDLLHEHVAQQPRRQRDDDEVAQQDAQADLHARVPACTTSRSEEQTSELQSLMRISYAVFCLKKKKNTMTKRKYYET